ncbi:MAG TPA: DUF1330 domain-containing protein [Acidocella sp.]|jgi:uncharacterized protein (DUF1330 family)|nr:DUF1330 domain-containing protein [Acidocella sp.]
MPAYVIILREEPVQDPAAMAEYQRLISLGPPPENLKPLVLYGAQESLLGTPPDGVVVLEFPTIKDAKEWYDSPRYREARVHRQKAARHREIIVEGFAFPAA